MTKHCRCVVYLCVGVVVGLKTNDFLSKRQLCLSPQQGNTQAGNLRLKWPAVASTPWDGPFPKATARSQPTITASVRAAGCGGGVAGEWGEQRDGSVNEIQRLRQHAPAERAVISELRAVRCTASLAAGPALPGHPKQYSNMIAMLHSFVTVSRSTHTTD